MRTPRPVRGGRPDKSLGEWRLRTGGPARPAGAQRLPRLDPMHPKWSAGSALTVLLWSAGCGPPPGAIAGSGMVNPYAPPRGMSAEAWAHGLAAHARARGEGLTAKPLLTVIDYSLPSSQRRLWVVDLATGAVLVHEYVAHAARSGGLWATAFSNRRGSYQSSLGAFLTGRSYVGVKGLSLRLRGLEPGINDQALPRGIVIHGTGSVTPARALQGRLGRTEGCPAVPAESARALVRLIEQGVVVFAWYPDRTLLTRSGYLDRGAAAIRWSAAN